LDSKLLGTPCPEVAHDLVVRCDGKCVFQYAYANDRFIDVVPRLKLNQYYTLERQNLGGAGALVGAGSSERMETMKASLEYGLDHFLRGCGWGLVNELPRIRHGYQLSFVGRTAGLVLALLRAWFVSRFTFSCRMTAARSITASSTTSAGWRRSSTCGRV